MKVCVPKQKLPYNLRRNIQERVFWAFLLLFFFSADKGKHFISKTETFGVKKLCASARVRMVFNY